LEEVLGLNIITKDGKVFQISINEVRKFAGFLVLINI
jgi:hypothetical protein